jgi:AraC family transcriptional regulator of adaptative response/methylated-DNA-[protein]-cysteine methyltransferase
MKAHTATPSADALPTAEDPRWSAVVARDASADGTFYYSVATTGVYCMPSCPARPARPETVRFHATPADAEAAGLRPCKRCRPGQPDVIRRWIPDEIRFAIGDCSLGLVLIAQSTRGVCSVLLGDDRDALRRDLETRFDGAVLIEDAHGLEALARSVVAFVESPGSELDVPLDVRGSEFQRRVWNALRQIPAGATATYTEIAERLGMPTGARAVARACATNPLAIVIPCHRVIARDGSLSGYRWGLDRKRALLETEARL